MSSTSYGLYKKQSDIAYGIGILMLTVTSPFFGGSLALLNLLLSDKNWRINAVCVSITIAFLSYNYVPENSGPDLYRYLQYIEELRGLRLREILNVAYHGYRLYAFHFLIWLCGAVNDTHLLPFVSVFIVYLSMMYCTLKVAEDESIDWKHARTYILFCLFVLDWYSVTNNVRNILAFAIVGDAVFRDLYLNRRDVLTGLMYVIPVFIHQSCLVLMVARILLIPFYSEKTSRLLPFASFAIGPTVDFLHSHPGPLAASSILLSVVNKAFNYYFDTSSSYGLRVQNSTRSAVARILYLSLVLLICLIEYRIHGRRKVALRDATKESGTFHLFDFMLGLMALSCIFMLRPEYWRFETAMVLFGGSIMLPWLQSRLKSAYDTILGCLTTFVAICCFAIWAYQLTWIDLPSLLSKFILGSPLVVFFRDIISGMSL